MVVEESVTMSAAPVTEARDRSRSPVAAKSNGAAAATATPFLKGVGVQFFHSADPIALRGLYVCPTPSLGQGPRFLQSHGWLDGVLCEDFHPEAFDTTNKATWPVLLPRQSLNFSVRTSGKVMKPQVPLRVPVQCLRLPKAEPPALSIVLVRWGGEHAVCGPNSEDNANDGDWGTYGAPPCDEYLSAFVREGVMKHPCLVDKVEGHTKFEIFNLFVKNSKDVAAIKDQAHFYAACMAGTRKMGCWMLWPAEWEDFSGCDYSAYVDRRAMFAAMRACEAAGIRTGFPHPADQLDMLTSKSWMATLALQPQARLPAATMVSKNTVMADAKMAARQALSVLNYIRAANPHPAHGEGGSCSSASPSEINKETVKKGVVKLGWSWEARYVAIFHDEEDLAQQLTQMLTHSGCWASSCIVQEWVDFEFEMRLYFLPPLDWDPSKELKPTRVECNAWSGSMENGQRRSFHKLTRESILERYWENDAEALDSAQAQATKIAQFLLRWMRLVDAQPVPMLRLDFMLHRCGPGRARVFFGEFCEMGACCLGWKEGPPTIWKSALDHALLL
mmetsp:Transcript_11015/g.25177  ORF Transcript_11015/g.25177 Transcript_11015/m.25177 type:complete len:560 (+) Transcript_11015:99-1778(+)